MYQYQTTDVWKFYRRPTQDQAMVKLISITVIHDKQFHLPFRDFHFIPALSSYKVYIFSIANQKQ